MCGLQTYQHRKSIKAIRWWIVFMVTLTPDTIIPKVNVLLSPANVCPAVPILPTAYKVDLASSRSIGTWNA